MDERSLITLERGDVSITLNKPKHVEKERSAFYGQMAMKEYALIRNSYTFVTMDKVFPHSLNCHLP